MTTTGTPRPSRAAPSTRDVEHPRRRHPVGRPSAEQVLDVVRAAVVRVLEVDPATVTRRTRLVEDLRADSLALVEVVELVEEELAPRAPAGLHVDDDAMEDLTTVGDAVDLVLGLLAG